MSNLIFVTHPEVIVDPHRPIRDWSLSEKGQRRAATFAKSEVISGVTAIWSSTEAKARQTAALLATGKNCPVKVDPALGENDRSATGFLSPNVFEHAADQFFAEPDRSYRGWETAQDAQSRIVTAVTNIRSNHCKGHLVIVSHGAVGTLLYCQLASLQIDHAFDQPSQGHYWVARLSDLAPLHGWQPIG